MLNYLDDEESILPEEENRKLLADTFAERNDPSSFSLPNPPQLSPQNNAPPKFGQPDTTPTARAATSSSPDPSAYNAASQKYATIVGQKPAPSKPKWWQQALSGAVGGLAGFSNSMGKGDPIDPRGAEDAIMGGPGNRRKLADWQRQVQGAAAEQEAAKGQLDESKAIQKVNAEKELRDVQMTAAKAKLTKLNSAPADYKSRFDQAKAAGASDEQAHIFASGGHLAPPKPAPATHQNYEAYLVSQLNDPDPAKASAAREELRGMKEKAGPKEVPKEAFQAILSKVAGAGGLGADTLTDVKKLSHAIETSPAITPEERNTARAYLAANTTPAAQGTQTTIRMEGYGASRELPVLDTKNGNSPQYLSANEINRANQQEPGRYIPESAGSKALNRTALLEDIRGSIGQTRNSLAAIPEFTPGDKATIAMALRDRDPKSAVSQLIGGAAGAHMSPAQQDYLINLAQLHEQAMAMRSVLGAGQGSEDLRAAILRTIPGPGTPNKAYAARQLDQFEATLNRLSRGVPNVKLRDTPQPATQQPTQQQPQGDPMIKVQIPNMPPGQIHASQKSRFLQDHPDAKVF